jgi:bifunctional enzyme CysN/CysC
VLVKKMDLHEYSQERFQQIEKEFRAFLKTVGLEPKSFIPIAAKHGDNIASVSSKMAWWQGPTVVQTLDEFKLSDLPNDQPLRFPVQDVYRFDERRILAGRVEAGTLRVGDRVLFSPGNKVSTVKSIERWQAAPRETASAGESVGITLTEQVFVERGSVATLETEPPYALTKVRTRMFWLGRAPFKKGKTYKIKLATQEAECQIDTVEKVIDASTLQKISRPDNDQFIGRHEVAELYIRTKRPIAFDLHSDIVALGRFVIVDGYEVSGGGVIIDDNYPKRTSDSLHKSENIFWSHGKVTPVQRAIRNGHSGSVVWLTGLSGAGKSTIATELERELFNIGKHAYVLDGDNVRHGLCSDLGFSPEDRKENIRRVGEVATLFAEAGIICITAFISPYRSDRELVRKMVKAGRFVEVHVDAPLAVCEERDPKGLYAKARANEIKEFTGISAPYEAPLRPEVQLHTDKLTVAEAVAKIVEYLHLQDASAEVSI